MDYKKIDIKDGITLNLLDTNRFKTNLQAMFLTIPLTREYVTYDAVLSSILRRGTNNLKSQDEISKKLEEMYGAEFDCGLNKMGNDHVLKFYIETINDNYIPQNGENMLKTGFDLLSDIIFNPLLENGVFNQQYFEQEKQNIKQIIEAKKDDKAGYALFRCMEEMYKDKPAGIYKFGYVEDLENMTPENLYNYYIELLKKCKIDIFISGNLDYEKTVNLVKNNENISKLDSRKPEYIINKPEFSNGIQKENLIEENLDVIQGKLIIGYDVLEKNLDYENIKYIGMLYSGILGGTANSKLFQNVREKASLAYTVSSSYSYYNENIMIRAGIEIKNFEKALELIKKQVQDMKNGDFTDEDILDVKKNIISGIKSINDEQDTEIIYYFDQELGERKINPDEYIEKIKNVSKSQILEFAQNININTIYFLKNDMKG